MTTAKHAYKPQRRHAVDPWDKFKLKRYRKQWRVFVPPVEEETPKVAALYSDLELIMPGLVLAAIGIMSAIAPLLLRG